MIKKLLFAPLCFAFSFVHAQTPVPNGGFEDWTNMGSYDEPTGYFTLNFLTFLGAPATTVQSSVAHGGTSSAENQCIEYTGLGGTDTLCGLAIGSFAWTDRPLNIEGWYQLVSTTTNHDAYLAVSLTKWNTTNNVPDTIAVGVYGTSTPTGATWTYFNLPLQYYSGDTPDSIQIIFGAGGDPTTLMRMDDLATNGSVAHVNDAQSIRAKLWPNPAQDGFTVGLAEVGEYSLSLTSADGRLVAAQQFSGLNTEMNVASLPAGVYLVTVTDAQSRRWNERLVIQR